MTRLIVDYGHIKEKGKPQLPLRGTMIGIPEKGKVTLKVTGSDYQTIHLKKDIISADLPNLPLQVNDEKTYGTNAFYPGSLATEGFTGYMRDQKVMQLLFYPVQYNPVTREVRIYKHISVEVTFDNSLTSLSKSNRKLDKEDKPATAGWTKTVQITSGSGFNTFNAAMYKDGSAILVYSRYDDVSGYDRVYANEYLPDSGWGIEVLVDAGIGDAYRPTVAFNPEGDALTVFTQGDGSNDRVYARWYRKGIGWEGSVTAIDGDGNGNSGEIGRASCRE